MQDALRPLYLLVTIVPLANGRRVIATSNFCGQCYHWRLLRNEHLISQGHSLSPYDTVVFFELKGPILPGAYRVELECLEDGFVLSSPSLPVAHIL